MSEEVESDQKIIEKKIEQKRGITRRNFLKVAAGVTALTLGSVALGSSLTKTNPLEYLFPPPRRPTKFLVLEDFESELKTDRFSLDYGRGPIKYLDFDSRKHWNGILGISGALELSRVPYVPLRSSPGHALRIDFLEDGVFYT